jgi:hypothetical protein
MQQNSQNPLKVDLDVSINQPSKPQKPSASGIVPDRPRQSPTRLINPAGNHPAPFARVNDSNLLVGGNSPPSVL